MNSLAIGELHAHSFSEGLSHEYTQKTTGANEEERSTPATHAKPDENKAAEEMSSNTLLVFLYYREWT